MFSSNVQISGNIKSVNLAGRIDMSNADECEELILTNLDQLSTIVLNLEELTFIDSTGVGSLVSAIRSAGKQNIRVELVNVPDGIEQILSLIGVFEVLEISNKNCGS